ncbi:MAG: DUF1843 domain-containing protein [Cyanobacteriota bacterium]
MAIYQETITGTLGYVGTPGAPIVHFVLEATIGAGSDQTLSWPINGKGKITQAIAPPDSTLLIPSLTGLCYSLGPSIFAVLGGNYILPSSGESLPFEAVLHFTANWHSGHGSFAYGGGKILHAPVNATTTDAGDFSSPFVVLYGATMQEAIKRGDLGRMKEVADQAETWLRNSNEISTTLDALKEQIKSLES